MQKKYCSISVIFVLIGFGFSTCSEKVSSAGSGDQSVQTSTLTPTNIEHAESASYRLGPQGETSDPDEMVGVYYMPSWDMPASQGGTKDIFWACLQGKEDCPFLKNTAIWGPKGRIYNAKYPYEGPYLDQKPHKSLKGFYDREDPEVVTKQLEYMKDYGIDFFAYSWYFGRHYYYHLDYAPQSDIYYPQGWEVDKSRDGRVAVPGIEVWTEQLTALLKANEKLPKEKQMKFALNWVDDGDERWQAWIEMGSPQNIQNKSNYPGETPTKELFLKVHDKMTLLWIDKYFGRDDYLTDQDGRPIVYFYFPHDTESRAGFYGVALKQLLDRSQELARKAGYKGIKFIAVTAGAMQNNERPYAMATDWTPKSRKEPWKGGEYTDKLLFQDYVPRLKAMGFEGLTAYIYHSFYGQFNRSYSDMRKTYRGHWETWSEYYKDDPGFEYQPPVAMGWNTKPMGGTWPQPSGFPSEPEKDEVISNKATFKAKLEEAKEISRKYRSTNGNTIMVCCWNEYLEGNHIEPSEGKGFDYLEAIKEVFSDD